MQRIFLLLTVLFISVICTACINNFAIQELNNMAKVHMEKGEIEKAICRLQSSVELDGNIFSTRYNLGVALIENNQFKEGEAELLQAQKLDPEYWDILYSLAVAKEGMGYEIINKESEENIKFSENEAPQTAEKELSAEEKTQIIKYFTEAIDNYNSYLSHKPDAPEKEEIANKVNTLNGEIKKYNPEISAQTDSLSDSKSASSEAQTAE